ncbi:MAG: glycosyltransferase [Chitinophagaceae bacterium]|nr:MAG: glycosyltransferase [Chitinophagaceae bacterium]
MEENKKLLSLVLLSYYSADKIHDVYSKVVDVMEKESIPFEFIIMDDGSKDDSYKIGLDLEKKDPRVRAYKLSRNYTSHYSRLAAFSISKGACATSIPDDLQLPLDIVVKMYRLWESGEKVVIPFRAYRKDGVIKDFFSNSYYNIMNAISDVSFPKGGADGFLVDREIIDILNNKIRPINTSTIIEVLRLGFDPVFIPYRRPTVNEKSRWTASKKIKLAMDTILASSSFPIKMITLLGVSSIFISFLFIVLSVVIKFTTDSRLLGFSIPGWTTNFILISFFSGMILFSLGIIAEYIWRIHEEVKDRPGFIIRKKE